MHTPKHARLTSPPQSATLPSESPRVTIEKLSNEVLLEIFRYYLHASPRFWLRLVHICRKWRRIVFASQWALHLRLFSTYGTPVLKTLEYWPALPIVVQYGGSLALDPPAPEDEDNIMAALKQSDRVSSISLTITSSLLEKLTAIERPFSQLEKLVLLSPDSVRQTLSGSFRWGPRLRCLHSTRIAFPSLLHLLNSSKNLVDLRLHEVINPWHFSPEALTDALSGMAQLRSLSLHLLTTANYIPLDLPPPPPPEARIVLPVLTHLNFRGIAEYLGDLVARIDAPRLGDIEVTLLHKFIFDPSKLSIFVDRIGMQKSHLRADIIFSERAISISITQPEASTRLEVQVSCEPLAQQLLFMADICNGLSTFLLGVEHLRIGATQPSHGQDNGDDEEWAKLIHPFKGARWIRVAGDHSTNIVRALQPPGGLLLPALHTLYIAQPGPRHAPLREAVVSFMTLCRLYRHSMAVEYEQLCHISELRGTVGPFYQQATIEILSDDVLLNIFRHYLDASPRSWPELAHVSRSWRQIIFASPLGLHLRLYCTYGTPILKNLASWPSLPLVLDYAGSPILRPPAPEDEDNIMAALEQSHRVCSISLTVSSSLLKKLSAISEPISELEVLVLLSQDNVQSTLPRGSAFWWGHRIRILHLTRIAIPSLPQLLLPSQDLVDLQLNDIPSAGYFPPEAFANALCGMTRLETLSLHFLSLPPRRNYLGLPPPPGDRVVLPALTRFKYRGISKYLDNLVARIDAPRLEEIDITFFNQPTLDASQLALFINRTETWEPPLRARIISSEDAISISITFTHPVAFERLRLQISCEQLDWQLSSITQICDHFSSSLSSVEDLNIETNGPPNVPDDMDDEQWLRLVRTFDGTKDFHVSGKLATDILHALRPGDEEHEIVFPSLRNLHIQWHRFMQGPLRDSVESFATQRRLSNHPVEIYFGEIHNLPKNIVDMPVQQLATSYSQLMRVVEDGEMNLNAAGVSTSGEGDMQRQAFRARLDQQKRLLDNIRVLIDLKRQGGGPAPQAQSNLPQMSPHVSSNGLPFNGALSQIPGAPPQPPPQAPRLALQRTIQCSKLPPLPEDRFKVLFTQFANTTGLRLNDRDFVIDGRPVSPWALHRAVFARNGFESVNANDEWPAVGAALGFPPFPAGDPNTQPLRCAPTIAHRLQQLYNDCLRHFEQAYLNNVIARLRSSQALVSAQASQQQAQPHQPTDADYQALLANIPSDASAMTAEMMSILPRFSHTSGAELEGHRVPPHVVAFVEQHRDNLQRAAQDQNGFRAGLTSTKNLPLDNRTQINPASAFHGMARPPPQPIPNHHTQLQMSRQPPAQAQGGKPNTLQSTQLINNGGLLARPSTAQSMGASSMSSMGTQITGAGPNGGAQGQSGSMSAPLTQGGMNVTASSSILTQSAGAIPIRRPTTDEVASAKRWVEEQRRTAFNHSFDGVASSPVPESEIPEYIRNLERLDMVLSNIERYIHIAFAALRKEDVVRRMFNMMASTKCQLEECKKPNPRYVLELHTIRGMIQEADNMDKGLRTVLGLKLAAQGNASVPQQPQQPPPMGPTPSFAPPAAPSATVLGSRPPPTAAFQSGHRKRPSQAQVTGAAMSTPTPPPPTVSTPTPQAATPGITAPSPQTPKSPKGKAAAKPSKVPARRKGSTKANSLETASSAPAVASTPTSSTPVDTKGSVKRVREDEADGTTPGVSSAPSPKRVKSDWEGPPNEEARKRDEQADNVKTDEQALAFFETVTKFIDENPESAEAASNALDEILRTYPPAPDIDDAAMASSFHFGDLPPTSPHPGNDVFGEFIDISAFDDTPTPDLVAGSSTNPSPESTSDQDHPHTGHAGSSPHIPNVKTEDTSYELLRPSVWKEISGGDAMFHQTPGWKWEGHMDTPDQPWLISTS